MLPERQTPLILCWSDETLHGYSCNIHTPSLAHIHLKYTGSLCVGAWFFRVDYAAAGARAGW